MIFDSIANLERYSSVSPYIKEVAEELKKKDFRALPEGLYYTEKNKILIQRPYNPLSIFTQTIPRR